MNCREVRRLTRKSRSHFYETLNPKLMKTIQIDNEVLSNLYDDCQDSLNEVFTEFISSYEVMTQDFSSAFNSGNLS